MKTLTTRMPRALCPHCGEVCSAATCPEGPHRPKPGDVSVCIHCGEVLEFDKAMMPIKVKLSSMMMLTNDQRDMIGRMQDKIRELRQ